MGRDIGRQNIRMCLLISSHYLDLDFWTVKRNIPDGGPSLTSFVVSTFALMRTMWVWSIGLIVIHDLYKRYLRTVWLRET